ncbi:ABC transporter substrate-binding protein [Nocardioides sp. B-3]|uniref:ABC transporter substrate-binding protein n=1 Tax=Nocardioides sp. B-3 TaxID=2895565 RepID=UPI003FA5DAD0
MLRVHEQRRLHGREQGHQERHVHRLSRRLRRRRRGRSQDRGRGQRAQVHQRRDRSRPEAQSGAIAAVVKGKPDLVILATGPTETAVIVGRAAARGFTGQFIGLGPTWNPALLESAAAPALEALYLQSGYWGSFGTDTPGHEAMREALGDGVSPNDGYTSGWARSYPLKAALEAWLEGDYDKSREGLLEAVGELETVDYEGMLPEEAGNFVGEPNDTVFRQSVISKVDKKAPAGISIVRDFFAGPTAEAHDFTGSCFEG